MTDAGEGSGILFFIDQAGRELFWLRPAYAELSAKLDAALARIKQLESTPDVQKPE